MSIQQYCLVGRGLCGRGVRVREMTAAECQANALAALDLVDKESTSRAALNIEQTRMQIKKMLVAVTRPGLTKKEILECKESEWHRLSLQELAVSDLFGFDAMFSGAKDFGALERIWNDLHMVPQTQMDAIMGEACAVAGEDIPPPGGTHTGATG